MKKLTLLTLAFMTLCSIAFSKPIKEQRGDTHILQVMDYKMNNTLYKASTYVLKVKNLAFHKEFYFASKKHGHGKVEMIRYMGRAKDGDDLFFIYFGFFDHVKFYVKMDGRQYELETRSW